jgi:hypothetical protein
MDLSIGVVSSLLKPLLSVASTHWTQMAEYQTLRRLAYEMLSRELHWNAECLCTIDANTSSEYIEILRTEAFDSLVASSVPMDLLLADPVRIEWLETGRYSTQQFKRRVNNIPNVSELIDRVYNRLWMLKHRNKKDLAKGDIAYLTSLLLFALAHVNLGRHNQQESPAEFLKLINLFQSKKLRA